MGHSLAREPLQKRFQHLFDVISSERFLKMQGIGKEVPFFICHFRPEEALEMEKIRYQLINQLEKAGVSVLDINLYDLSISLLKEIGIFEKTIEVETSAAKDAFLEHLQGSLDPEKYLIPSIAKSIKEHNCDVIFVSGIGEVYPYIRAHTFLNNLQSTAKEQPTVMFYPGEYRYSPLTGTSLDLFGRLHDDKYYRAFDIFLYEPELRSRQ